MEEEDTSSPDTDRDSMLNLHGLFQPCTLSSPSPQSPRTSRSYQSSPSSRTSPSYQSLVRGVSPGYHELGVASLDFDYDSGTEEYDDPTERWTPLGAASSPPPASPVEPSTLAIAERLHSLEEEQEHLNSSLLALTSHFAQVQFRLRQIVNANPAQREVLLKDLENFAFKGIPDVRGCHVQDAQILEHMNEREHEERMKEQREKQRELITQLKSQLEDLETYAYESGNAEAPPTSHVLEKQKVLLEEVRSKLHIDLHNFDKLDTDELKKIIDNAVGSIVNPARVKEKLVEQLKTQVVDLERYIQFLQGETDNPGPYGQNRCTCPVHHKDNNNAADSGTNCGYTNTHNQTNQNGAKTSWKPKGRETVTELLRKIVTMLQIYVFSQLGCGNRDFKQNSLKKTSKANHWGDLRARLELTVTRTLELVQLQQDRETQRQRDDQSDGDLTTDTDESERWSSPAVTLYVRKELSMAVRDLMQHGLVEETHMKVENENFVRSCWGYNVWLSGVDTNKNGTSDRGRVARLGCFSERSSDVPRSLHPWQLLTSFYDMKHGREYNESPARMLSQSFHLQVVGGRPITAKQTLLSAIDTVFKSHRPYKRGADSYFKAFVCLALNERKLVAWLRLLFRTQTLVDQYYQDWSYVAHTGFEDALQSLERLMKVDFHLPVDLSVRPFTSSHDAF